MGISPSVTASAKGVSKARGAWEFNAFGSAPAFKAKPTCSVLCFRITSYNVCYTKLLRTVNVNGTLELWDISATLLAKNGIPKPANDAFSISPIGIEAGSMIVVSPDQKFIATSVTDVITSYSIHYTKLYDKDARWLGECNI